MASSNTATQPNPMAIFQAFNGYQLSMALKAAIELDLFTHIADGARDAAQLALCSKASERGVRSLCDYLTVTGFLIKQDGTYGLTIDSATFLSKRSPGYLGAAVFFMTHERQIEAMAHTTEAVRKGGTASRVGPMEQDDPVWVEFARWMGPISANGADAVAECVSQPGREIKVLDIAAGPGAYGIAVARRNPAAQIVALDWKNVLEVTLEHARAAGVADRFRTIPGSAFEVDFGTGYDLILLPNFLHHFDPPTNVKLLKKVRAALVPGGQVATVEFVPNDDRVSPPAAAVFSLTMLVHTDGGDAYTFKELDRMFREAGFGKSRLIEIPPAPQPLILTTV
jgi:predicted nicotinamide N-methyase